MVSGDGILCEDGVIFWGAKPKTGTPGPFSLKKGCILKSSNRCTPRVTRLANHKLSPVMGDDDDPGTPGNNCSVLCLTFSRFWLIRKPIRALRVYSKPMVYIDSPYTNDTVSRVGQWPCATHRHIYTTHRITPAIHTYCWYIFFLASSITGEHDGHDTFDVYEYTSMS